MPDGQGVLGGGRNLPSVMDSTWEKLQAASPHHPERARPGLGAAAAVRSPLALGQLQREGPCLAAL